MYESILLAGETGVRWIRQCFPSRRQEDIAEVRYEAHQESMVSHCKSYSMERSLLSFFHADQPDREVLSLFPFNWLEVERSRHCDGVPGGRITEGVFAQDKVFIREVNSEHLKTNSRWSLLSSL